MSGVTIVLLAVGLLGAALLVGLIIRLTRARVDQAVAETNTATLLKGKERRHEADKIMAEPVAHEDSWLAATRERLGMHDDDHES